MRRNLGVLLVFMGAACLALPVVFNWWLHGSSERYMQIISGPYPFDRLGSGPLQLWIAAAFLGAGSALIIWGRTLWKSNQSRRARPPA